MTQRNNKKLVVVSKDVGKERWSKYPVSEENMAIIDEELKNEFLISLKWKYRLLRNG